MLSLIFVDPLHLDVKHAFWVDNNTRALLDQPGKFSFVIKFCFAPRFHKFSNAGRTFQLS